LPEFVRSGLGNVPVDFDVKKISTKLVLDRQLQELMGAFGSVSIPYSILDKKGIVVAAGALDEFGRTERVFRKNTDELTAVFGTQGTWDKIEHDEDDHCGCGGDHAGGPHEDVDEQAADAPSPVTATKDSVDIAPQEHADHHPQVAPDFDEEAQQTVLKHLLTEYLFKEPHIAQIIADGEE
jgi:type VI secretion system secreted protein VgrG